MRDLRTRGKQENLNFALPIRALVKPLAICGWGLSLLLGLWLYDGWNQAETARESIEGSRNRLNRLEKALDKQGPGIRLPSEEELKAGQEQIARLNQLHLVRGRSSDEILQKIAELLPKEVYLTSFEHDAKKGEVRINGVARTKADSSKLIALLEEGGGFAKVTLPARHENEATESLFEAILTEVP